MNKERDHRRFRGCSATVVVAALLLVLNACGGATKTTASPTTSSSAATTTTISTTTTTASSSTSSSNSTSTTTGSTSDTSFGTVAPSTTLTPGGTSLSDPFVPEHTIYFTFAQTVINGINYPNALKIQGSDTPGSVQINLGRSYTHFTGSLGIPDDQKAESVLMVSISFDNSAPVLSKEVSFGTTTPLSLNVTGVLRMKITVSSASNCCAYVAIGNPIVS